MGLKDDINWRKLINGDASVLEDPEIDSFLNTFGELLLPSNIPITKMTLEHLSRDLNIKFFISIGSTIQETWSFKYPSPVPISFHLKSQNPYIIDSILHRSELSHTPSPNLSKKFQNLLEITQIFEQMIENFPLSKDIKNWADQMVSQDPQAGNNWTILTSIQKAPNKINLTKELKTAYKSFAELDSFHREPMTQTPLVAKFGGIAKIDYNAKITEIIKREPRSVGISNPSEATKLKSDSPSKVAREELKMDSNSGDKAFPSSRNKFHCKQCETSPLDKEINSMDCKCPLFQDCLQLSLIERKCIACAKPISDEAYNRMNLYFG